MMRGFVIPASIIAAVQADGIVAFNNTADGPVLTTPLGAVVGMDYGDFYAFKGLPYAQPPKRFAPPEPMTPWQGVRDATHFGSACITGMANPDLDPKERYFESEDCLFANVWAPKLAQITQPMPVLVFIHGGAFVIGTGSFPWYWGDEFVTLRDGEPTLLVTFNYRLSVFGFYSSDDAGANFGFQDQQLLLRWVRDNIASFGGDPSRVTISGQSAGGMSVICHLVAPGSAGLFHRAASFSPVGLHYRTPAENAPFVKTVAETVGCGTATDVTDCLRKVSPLELEAADMIPEYFFHFFGTCDGCDNILPWLPVMDGNILPMSPIDAIRAGKYNKVPTIISTTMNETLVFVPSLLKAVTNRVALYDVAMDVIFDKRADEVKMHYQTAPDTEHIALGAQLAGIATTDALMTCYSRYVARLLAPGPVYLSVFKLQETPKFGIDLDNVCGAGAPNGAACHTADVPFFFPCSERMGLRTGCKYTGAEAQRAFEYADALRKFVHGDEGPFKQYSREADVVSTFDNDGWGVAQGYHKVHCDWYEENGFVAAPWGGYGREGPTNVSSEIMTDEIFV